MRKHAHEEERRTKKLRKLTQMLGDNIQASKVSEKDVAEALRVNAQTLANNPVYQAWKSRN